MGHRYVIYNFLFAAAVVVVCLFYFCKKLFTNTRQKIYFVQFLSFSLTLTLSVFSWQLDKIWNHFGKFIVNIYVDSKYSTV